MHYMVLVLTITNSFSSLGQRKATVIQTRPLNNIYINIFGDVSLVSVNYERIKIISPYFFLSGNIGVGHQSELQICFFWDCTFPESKKFITFPHHLTLNFGKKKHFLEAGLGGTYVYGITQKKYFIYPLIGYRIQPLKSKKAIFRLYFNTSAFNSFEENVYLNIPAGISIGISF